MSTQAASLAHGSSFKLGEVTIEPARRIIRRPDGAEQRIEPRVMQVLLALAGAKGAILSRADLRDICWDGRLTSDDAIDRVMAQIRRLGTSVGNDSFTVETVPKVGYRLVEYRSCEGTQRGRPGFDRRFVIGGAVAVAFGGGAAVTLHRAGRTTARRSLEPLTIAVLPFTTETPGPELASFAASLSDEVRSDLSRVVDIRVIAQTSSRKVSQEEETAQQIARSLGADYLVEGQVGNANGQVVTRIALIDSKTGSQAWTAQETAPISDPTRLRPAIAGDVIQQLAGFIPLSNQRGVPVQRPDPEAYALVQAANRMLEDVRANQMRGREADALSIGDKAEQLAQRALAVDPDYSAALAVLAAITRNGWTTALARQNLTTKQRVQASVAIVRRALLADPRDPAALTALGDYYRRYEFRWDEAENLFRRALSIDPSFLDAHWSFSYELGTLGRGVEGLDHALAVFELDPRNPFRRIALPRLLYIVGRRADAMRRYTAELAEQPDNLFLLRELYFMFLSERNAGDLQNLGERILRRAPTPELTELRNKIDAGVLALQGKPKQLRSLVDAEVSSFDRTDAVSNATPQGRARDDLPFIFAIEYACAGLPDHSIDMLERAISAKSLYWPAALPFGIAQFPPIVQNNPRYQALWERDPGVIALVRRRYAALSSGQMFGFTPDGRKLTPHIPPSLERRVQAALSTRA